MYSGVSSVSLIRPSSRLLIFIITAAGRDITIAANANVGCMYPFLQLQWTTVTYLLCSGAEDETTSIPVTPRT
jgi:hypothetical protein